MRRRGGDIDKATRTLAIVSMLAGCAGSDIPVEPTPYQEYNPTPSAEHPAGGYLSEEIAHNTYLVTFRGTTVTDQDTVIAYAYRRAAELCGGDNRFAMLNDEDASKVEDETRYRGLSSVEPTGHTYHKIWPRRRLTVRCKGE
jgi:hypothetical protein